MSEVRGATAPANQRLTAEPDGLRPYLSPLAAWALAVGTSIGWGSFVITSNTFLASAGPLGSLLGLLVGLAVMLVIARNYHYLVVRYTSAGGAYTYAREVFGSDCAFAVAWFLGLTYAAMLWANASSLPLFARYALGDVLQFGFHYQIFGYDVYLGEMLVAAAAIMAAGWFCTASRRGVARVIVVLVIVFTACICACFIAAMGASGGGLGALAPAYAPKGSVPAQVARIACMAPWAFIGFESITHSSEEFRFEKERSFGVLAAALVVTALLYVFITLLSATAQPAGYDSWVSYVANLDGMTGLDRYPAFFAGRTFLGSLGVALLATALLALVGTSLVGNIVALSRLFYALAEDGVLPHAYAELNGQGEPQRAIRLIVMVSLLVPLLGRTAIGWIVDVTTLGATITYGFVSLAAFRKAHERSDRLETCTGLVGLVLAMLLGLLLLPGSVSTGAMAQESFFLFTVWAMLGFVCFRAVLLTDDEQRFGHTMVVWMALLSLVLVTLLTWMTQALQTDVAQTADEVHRYYLHHPNDTSDEAFLSETEQRLQGRVQRDVTLVGGLFIFSMGVLLSNFSIIQRRERESQHQLGVARTIANTDPLTGVKNKNAYVAHEGELDYQIGQGLVEGFAVVVCDVNGLKQVNDTLGHKAGDEYIRAASRLICQLFKHSPVFRIGGDEFVVILQGSDYERRDELMSSLDYQSVTNLRCGEVVVAGGMAEFGPGEDQRVAAVFERADALMYQRKKELKALAGQDADAR